MSEQEDDSGSSLGSTIEGILEQLEDFCASDDLSIEELRRMTEGISPDVLAYTFALHHVCVNEKVTLEIVQYLLDLNPLPINSCDETEEGEAAPYPLHLACYNENCPNEVVQLLITKSAEYQHLKEMCYMNDDWANTNIDSDLFGGTPIHYYLSRTSNVDLDIVKQLSSKRLLLSADSYTKCTPIHIIVHNEYVGDMVDVLRYLVELNPSSLQKKDEYDLIPLHVACQNEFINIRTIQVLLRAWPNSIHQRDSSGSLPIHLFCGEKSLCGVESEMDDEVELEILKLLLDAYPDSVSEVDPEWDAELPIHKAARNMSRGCCELLVDAYPESVRSPSGAGSLPFLDACCGYRLDTVEYLFRLYPEGLHIRTNKGRLPIHSACGDPNKNTSAIIKFLLRHDPECVSKPIVSDDTGNNHTQGNGALPLHVVCNAWDKSNDVTELIFDIYPEAILIRNDQQQLPIDVLRQCMGRLNVMGKVYNKGWYQRGQGLISFLQTQMIYAIKAQDRNLMTTPVHGILPLHNAVYDNAPLGSIKLLVKGYPDAINITGGTGMLPLDLACEVSTVSVVEYLAKLSPDRLNACDVNKNSPLHHACRGGNCKVIGYLLETPMSSASVSERNVDDMLPIHLFCKFVNEHEGEEKDIEYAETIWCLLSAYPETVLNW